MHLLAASDNDPQVERHKQAVQVDLRGSTRCMCMLGAGDAAVLSLGALRSA